MKSTAATLTILLLTSIFGGCTTVKAQPAFTPHEDPTALQSTIDTYSFLSEYAAVFALISNKQYENASRLSDQLRHITVPSDLKYITGRYNQLTQQLITALNELQTALNTAQALLDQNRLSEAEQALEKAGVLIAKAETLLGDLREATATLSQRLRISTNPAKSSIREAYNQLQNLLQQLNDLIEQYHTLLQKANKRVQEIKTQNFNPTVLSLTLDSTKCFVGDFVTASGMLTSNGNPLEKRTVKIFLDGSQVATADTDVNGNYQAIIKMPYKYVDSVLVNATYTPEANDKSRYLGTFSLTIKIQVLYYKTMLDLSVSNIAYPGLSLSINGSVTAQDETPQKEREVKIFLGNTLEAQVKTDQSGFFCIEFKVEPQTALGKHSLTVSVEPNGLYAPTSEQRTINIEKMTTYLQVNSPAFILLPTQLQITGIVNSASGPLKGTTVQCGFENASAATKTQSDGSFNLTIEVPLNAALAGYQELIVQAQPAQPWQIITETKASVFVLNSVSTSLALASSLSVFAVTYLRFTKTKKNKAKVLETEKTTTLQMLEKDTAVTIAPIPPAEFEGAKKRIVETYIEALTIVQTATGNTLEFSMTLREYTRASCPKIGNASKPFIDLTALAEKSLYSPHEPSSEELQKAEELAKSVRRILTGTT